MVNKKVKRSLRHRTRRSMYRKKSTKANRRGLAFASRKSRRASRKSRRVRRHRGGSYLEGASRPFFASVYPNTLQTAYAGATGAEPNNYPGSPSPENASAPHSWTYIRDGTPIPPDMVTRINTGFTLMAGNTPYAPSPLMAPGAGVSSGTATMPGTSMLAGTGTGTGAAGSGAGAGAGVPQSSIITNIVRGVQSTQSF